MVYIISILIWFLTIIQGGFFVNSYGIAAGILLVSLVVCCIKAPGAFVKQMKERQNPVMAAGFFLILVSFVISGWVHTWDRAYSDRLIYVGFALLCYISVGFVREQEKAIMYRQVRYLLYVQVVFCILDYLGIVVFSTMQNARFMGTMQYANATAIFMAVGIFLQNVFENGQEKEWRYLKLLTMVVFCTTFSAGGMFCYLAGCLLYGIMGEKEKRAEKLLFSFAEFGVSLLLAMSWYVSAFRFKNTAITVALIVLTMICSCFWQRIEKRDRTERTNAANHLVVGCLQKKKGKTGKYIGGFCTVVILLIVAGTFLYLFGSRVEGTGAERLAQMKDAVLVLLQHPLAGIGVDRWGDYFALRPDFSYHASYVHCSYLHLGVELGMFAMAGMVVVLLGKFYQSKRNQMQNVVGITATLMLCLHFFVDFTGFFAGVLLLAMIVGDYRLR